MRWPWRRRRPNGEAAKAKAEALARLRFTQAMTPAYERMADHIADLTDEEFAERVARAFRRRPA